MTQIHILFRENRYHVVLRHEDGAEEISDQSWNTREECEKAVEQYAKDRGQKLTRTQ
jgi:hypothetical protein